MQMLILLVHIVLAFSIIALVLLQQGKGATMGAAFGSGASNTLFGSAGPASFLMKLTALLMALFFVTSLSLSYLAKEQVMAQAQLAKPITHQSIGNKRNASGQRQAK